MGTEVLIHRYRRYWNYSLPDPIFQFPSFTIDNVFCFPDASKGRSKREFYKYFFAKFFTPKFSYGFAIKNVGEYKITLNSWK